MQLSNTVLNCLHNMIHLMQHLFLIRTHGVCQARGMAADSGWHMVGRAQQAVDRIGIRASPTGAVYRLCAKKDVSLAHERLMLLKQRLQTGALKQSAWQNAIQGTIYSALESAHGKHTTRTYTPKITYFLEPNV
jgi:hypothetical protein